MGATKGGKGRGGANNHLGMHAEWGVGKVASPIAREDRFERCEGGGRRVGQLRLGLRLAFLTLLLQVIQFGGSTGSEAARLESTPIVAWTIIVVALTDNFASSDDDTAMTIVQWGVCSRGEAEGEVPVCSGRHGA